MKTLFLSATLMCGLTGFGATSAQADEIRPGVMIHDSKLFDGVFGGLHGKEQSISVTGEYIFKSPDWLSWAYSPKPFVGGSLNLGGQTSFGGAGLLWRHDFQNRYYADLGFGLVVHNGVIRTPDPLLSTDLAEVLLLLRRKITEIEFGARYLFRTQFAFGYRFNEKWAGEIAYEHLSHGQILGGPENEGLNNIGFRVARRF
ncbi:MAG: acyloxyacyl hydrolase [Robiginitomaculum sp.]|nr:acyloxyacyl hydrolase [Robiginitomaculum sp.]